MAADRNGAKARLVIVSSQDEVGESRGLGDVGALEAVSAELMGQSSLLSSLDCEAPSGL